MHFTSNTVFKCLFRTNLLGTFACVLSQTGSGRTRDEVTTIINQELVKIAKWFTDNLLTLHPDKSRFIVHSRDKLIEVLINGTKVMRCSYSLQEESVKFLGLHVDENLDWAVHIKNVI